MEYVYGALLLHAAGKEINEEGVTNVLKAAGVTAEPARVKALVSALDGVDVAEAIKNAAVAPVAAVAAAGPAADAPKEEEPEEEAVSEEEAAAGLGALFG